MISNFFELFVENYQKHPYKRALVFYPEFEPKIYTYKEVYQNVLSLQEQIKRQGVKKDSRVLMLSEPGPGFYFFSLALIALGATPVFIEAKKEGIFRRLMATSSDFVLFNNKTKKLKFLFPYFWNKKAFIFESKSFGIHTLKNNISNKDGSLTLSQMKDSDPLLISFTTGSTGRSKAADRNYFVSYNQHCASLKYWLHDDDDVDLTFFPNILFQNLCSGVTTLIPKMLVKDLKHIPFNKFKDVISKYKVTRISAPPGYLNQLCNAIDEPINQISKVITGGAPVDKKLAKKTLETFPNAEANVVYGSTEAEPIAFKSLQNVANSEEDGFLVGKPIDEIKILINNPNKKTLEPCEVGEILISGNHVVQRYLNSDVDNKEFKIKDEKGTVWHRTGDIGHFNSDRDLVILGRKNFGLNTKRGQKFSLSLENMFNKNLPGDRRCAIIQKNQKTYLKIESPSRSDIESMANLFMSDYFEDFEINFIEKIPVDFRHHWKVDYSTLLKK